MDRFVRLQAREVQDFGSRVWTHPRCVFMDPEIERYRDTYLHLWIPQEYLVFLRGGDVPATLSTLGRMQERQQSPDRCGEYS